MKKPILSTLLALGVLASSAGVLDLQSRFDLLRHQRSLLSPEAMQRRTPLMRTMGIEGQALTPDRRNASTLAFASLASGSSRADLEAEGITVLAERGGVAIVKLPMAEAEQVAASRHIHSLQLQRTLRPHLDLARNASGVEAIHTGNPTHLPKAFTGKGVLTGIVDQGVDPNHINFIGPDGENRIKYLSYIRDNAAGTDVAETYYGSDVKNAKPISDFSTDDATAFHGTHTLGILAGGYRGNVEVSTGMGVDGKPMMETVANPFVGVAPEAQIAVSCGPLRDALVAYGIDVMLSYGVDYLKKPMVYNLSLGSTTGPHDVNSNMNRFLNEVAKYAIVCVSAGNEGDAKVALYRNFTAQSQSVKTFVHPHVFHYTPGGTTPYDQNTWRYGTVAIYSDTDTKFDTNVVIYNKKRSYRSAYTMPVVGDGNYTLYCTSKEYASTSADLVADTASVFAKRFNGYVAVAQGKEPETGRHYALIHFDLLDTELNNQAEDYLIGLEVKGTAGQRIDMYTDAQTVSFSDNGVLGFIDGSRNGSISDMAVAPNIIAVGSYNTRQQWHTLDGNLSGYPGEGFAPGYISEFSSFGTLADGRKLPHVCAPGAAIMSSISNPYLKKFTDDAKVTPAEAEQWYNYLNSARTTLNGTTYYWKQEVGTSMASPYVAGSIALWLEADPTLTSADVQEIIAATATVDEQVLAGDPVQWGAGKFNALEGLKEVIRRHPLGGIDLPATTNNRLMVTAEAPRSLRVFVGDAPSLTVAVTSLTGATLLTSTTPGDETLLDLSALPSGLYILTANGHSQKITLP